MSNLAAFNGVAQKLSGGFMVPAPAASIEVRREDTAALAAIFSDEAGATPLTNPSAFADAEGNFTFYAAGLARGYKITVTDGVLQRTLRNVGVGTLAQQDNPLTTKGDLLVTLAGALLARKAVGSDGYLPVAESGAAENLLWLPPVTMRDCPFVNGELIESHAGNAVTFTLKGRGGIDLSATNPCYLFFPSATLTGAGFDIVKLTANISVTVSSGSTLGQASNIPQHIFVYAINNAGAAELAVSTLPPDYPGTFGPTRLVTTVAEGGAGAADSATVIYSTTARTNVPWATLAKVKGTQTTAGTWAAAPTQMDMAPFTLPRNLVIANRNAVQNIANNTQTKVAVDTETADPDSVFDAVTNNRYQPNVAGYYRFSGATTYNGVLADQSDHDSFIFKNGANVIQAAGRTSGAALEVRGVSGIQLMNGTTDFAELYTLQNSGGAQNLAGGVPNTFFHAERIGQP